MAFIRKRGNKFCVVYKVKDEDGAEHQKSETYASQKEADSGCAGGSRCGIVNEGADEPGNGSIAYIIGKDNESIETTEEMAILYR